jgi:hypothetical protein
MPSLFDPLCLITQHIIVHECERASAEHQYGCRAVHPCLTFAATAAVAAAADAQHSKSKMATAVCAFAQFCGWCCGELMYALATM